MKKIIIVLMISIFLTGCASFWQGFSKGLQEGSQQPNNSRRQASEETRPCLMCDGFGWTEKECYRCNGSGVSDIECYGCNGTGRSYGTRCSTCRGTGYAKCINCDGRGFKREKCIYCNGKGYKNR